MGMPTPLAFDSRDLPRATHSGTKFRDTRNHPQRSWRIFLALVQQTPCTRPADNPGRLSAGVTPLSESSSKSSSSGAQTLSYPWRVLLRSAPARMAPSPGCLFSCFRGSDSSLNAGKSSTSKANGVAEERNSAYPLARLNSSCSSSSPLTPEGHDDANQSQRHGWTGTVAGTPSRGSTAGASAGARRSGAGNKVVPIKDGTQGNASISLRAQTALRDSPSAMPRPDRPRPPGARPLPPDLVTPDSAGVFNSGEFLTGEQLYAAGFKLFSAQTVTTQLPSSSRHPLTFMVLDTTRIAAQHQKEAEARLPGARISGRGTGETDARGFRNTLVPVFTNSCCRSYFKIGAHSDYVAVIKKLLKRDPLLSFALQKAVRHLKGGDSKSVSHVTPDPSGQTSSLYGLRLTPCVWRQDGRVLPSLMVEHNLPYDPDVVMPRLMRDYAVLSHVPAILTLIDFEGKVLYQNASSLEYMGDLLSAKYNPQLSEGLLQVLYMYDLHSLEQMLEHVLGGLEWQGVVQVPYSLKRFLGQQQDSDTVIDFIRTLAAPGAMIDARGARYGYGDDGYDDDVFQIGGGAAARMQRKAQQASLLVKQSSAKQGHASLMVAGGMGGTRSDSGTGVGAFGMDGPGGIPAALHRELMHSNVSPRFSSGTERRVGSASGTAGATGAAERRLSFLAAADMAPGMQQRKFMSLLDKQVASPTPGSAGERVGREGSVLPGTRGISAAGNGPSRASPSDEYMAEDDERAAAGILEDEGEGLEDGEEQECYHEVHAIPLLDPVLDKQVIMLVQTDVTPRVELENKLADLTDAQLSMLEQLFPRHIIEYMLAREPSKVSNNMRDLANTHEKVMVLFCDVVGFTSMSKEVEAAQVMHFLNELYETFDDLVDDYDMYKLDIVGDCYIVVAGLIKEDQDGFVCVDELEDDQVMANAERIMGFAKKMLSTSQEVLMPHNSQPVSLRIGIHTGPLVSGLVGSKMPKFTLFGDTMNTASRMESTCRPGCIHVSDAFGQLLPHEAWESTGGVQVKGKGLMETLLWVPEHQPQEAESVADDGSREGRSLKKIGTLNQSFTSNKSRHTVRSTSTRRRESQTSGGEQTRGESVNPLMTILHNIGGGFRDEEGGGEAASSTGLMSTMRPKSGRLRLGPGARRAPSTTSGLEVSGEFERRAEGGGMSGSLRPRASNQVLGAGGKGLSGRGVAAGSRRASYLEPLAQYPEVHLET